MIEWKNWYWVVVFLPVVVGMIQGRIQSVNLKIQKNILNVRPEPWVFSVVWTLLYLMYGTSWSFALSDPQYDDLYMKESNIQIWIVYSLTLLMMFIWTPIFNKNARNALWVLFISLMGVLFCYGLSPLISKLLLTPLMVWLLFAGMMNYSIVMKKKRL